MQWRADAPGPRFGHACVCLDERTMLTLFGADGDNSFLDDSHTYELGARRWQLSEPQTRAANEPRPLARAFHTACLDAKRRRVLVFGGRGSQGDLDDLSVFDVATGRWHVGVRTSGLAPGARSKHSAAVVGDTMFVFGGENARRPVDPRAMFALDLDKMQWSLVRYTGVMPRCVGLQCAAVGSRLFVFCSEQEAPLRMLNCVSVFLAATSEWIQVDCGRVADAPCARRHYSFVPLGHLLFLYGGLNVNDIPLGDLWVLDANMLVWRVVESDSAGRGVQALVSQQPPCPRSMHTAVAAGAHLYVFGGRDDDNSQQTVFHDVHSFCLDPALASAALASPNEQALQSALRRFRQAAASVDRTLCHEEWDAVLDGVERYIAALTLQRDRQRRWAAELLHRHETQVVLDVGGKRFYTSLATLQGRAAGEDLDAEAGSSDVSAGDQMLSAMCRFPSDGGAREFFVDRDPTYFRYVLNFLRDGRVVAPPSRAACQELLREANFYQLDGLTKQLRL